MDTEHEVLATPTTAITEYRATEQALATLRETMAAKQWDLTTVAGNAEARQTRKVLVSLRTGLDAKRKELNADDQARIAARNAEAQRITGEIVKLETPLDAIIRADETRREVARAAREAAERARLDAINVRLDALRQTVLQVNDLQAFEITEMADGLAAMDFADEDDVHGPVFIQTRDTVVAQLRDLAVKAEQREADAAELAQRLADQEQREHAALVRIQLDGIRHGIRTFAGTTTADVDAELALMADTDPKMEFGSENEPAVREALDAYVADLTALRDRLAEQERIAAEQAQTQRDLDAAREKLEASRRELEQAQAQREAEHAEAIELERQQAEARENAKRAVEQEAAEKQEAERLAAAHAEAERIENERAADRLAAEHLAIQNADLRTATQAGVDLLTELGQSTHLTTRMMISALARTPKPAKAKKVTP